MQNLALFDADKRDRTADLLNAIGFPGLPSVKNVAILPEKQYNLIKNNSIIYIGYIVSIVFRVKFV